MKPKPKVRIETRQMPLQTREAPIVAVDAEKRTADVVWTTGARVRRYDYSRDRPFYEELSLDPKHVRMGRLESGKAPLLNTHSRWSLGDVLGVISSATLGQEPRASVRFSKRDDVTPVFQDVRDGILCNVSVGYTIHRIEMIPPETPADLWVYRVIDWEPTEISIVAVGADAGSTVTQAAGRTGDSAPPNQAQDPRTWSCEFLSESSNTPPAAAGITREDTPMTDEEKQAAEKAAQQKRDAETLAAKTEQDRIRKEAGDAEAARSKGIREAVRLGGLDETFADELIEKRETTPADAGLAVLREQAKRAGRDPTRAVANVTITRDETETRREAMIGALQLRSNPRAKLTDKQVEIARPFRHMSLLRMAEECLSANGINVRGLSGLEIAGRALHSTSDYPAILANVLNKRLRSAYDESPGSYRVWAKRAPNAPDFKQIQVTQMGGAPDLLPVGESGEIKYGTVGEGKEKYNVVTYARIVALNRQVIINDDLRAFDRLVAGFGSSAARLENRTVYAILTANANLDDGVALFHATHANLTGTGTAIDVTSLGVGRSLMRKQKGLASEELNIVPVYLIVPTAKEQLAYQYTSSQFVPAVSSNVNEFRQGGRTALTPVVEPVLDASSATAWYLAADGNQIDTVEYCYLDGSEGVFIENEIGFDVDGMKLKARLDFAAKAIDFRGVYKNAGA